VLYWCDGGATLESVDCVVDLGWLGCGWSSDIDEYDCSDEATSSPLSGLPWLCPGYDCANACAGKQCGYECGVACGTCPAGAACNPDGTCP
jgi:hypothetical protein